MANYETPEEAYEAFLNGETLEPDDLELLRKHDGIPDSPNGSESDVCGDCGLRETVSGCGCSVDDL